MSDTPLPRSSSPPIFPLSMPPGKVFARKSLPSHSSNPKNASSSSVKAPQLSFEEALQVGSGSNMPAKTPHRLSTLPSPSPSLPFPRTCRPVLGPPVHDAQSSPVPFSQSFVERVQKHERLSVLAAGLNSSGNAKRAITDPFYREVLVTRYMRLRPPVKEEKGSEKAMVDVTSVPDVDGVLQEAPSFGNAAAQTAESVRKSLVIRHETTHREETLDAIRFKLPRDGGKLAVMNRVLDVIASQYMAECASQGIAAGASLQFTTRLRNAGLLRAAFRPFNADGMQLAIWAHGNLLQVLPMPFLTTYLDLLRCTRQLAPLLIESITGYPGYSEAVKDANQLVRRFIFQKVLDPLVPVIAKSLPKSCFNHVHFLMVPPSPTLHHTTQPSQSRSRAHEYFYRTLLPSLGPSEVFRLVLPDKRMTVAESADVLIAGVKERCVEIHRRQPQTRIVLVGWATSCLINCRELNFIAAMLNFAFPLATACAYRGDVDDDILTMGCASLFIVGQFAVDCNLPALQDLRDHLSDRTGVIVLGSANSNLYVSTRKLIVERLTQRAVDRVLLDHIIAFLEKMLAMPPEAPMRFARPLTAQIDLPLLRPSRSSHAGQTRATMNTAGKRTRVEKSPPMSPVEAVIESVQQVPASRLSNDDVVADSPTSSCVSEDQLSAGFLYNERDRSTSRDDSRSMGQQVESAESSGIPQGLAARRATFDALLQKGGGAPPAKARRVDSGGDGRVSSASSKRRNTMIGLGGDGTRFPPSQQSTLPNTSTGHSSWSSSSSPYRPPSSIPLGPSANDSRLGNSLDARSPPGVIPTTSDAYRRPSPAQARAPSYATQASGVVGLAMPVVYSNRLMASHGFDEEQRRLGNARNTPKR